MTSRSGGEAGTTEPLNEVKVVATDVTVIAIEQMPSAPGARKEEDDLTSQCPSDRAEFSFQFHTGHEALCLWLCLWGMIRAVHPQ